MTDAPRLAPTKKRARMLATVFSMQAFGCAAATITAIVVVSIVRHYHPSPSQVAVDQIWRWVMGLSLIPATIAVVMRCFVPESPRFTLYVLNYPFRALQEADILNQAGVQDRHQRQYEDRAIRNYVNKREHSQSSSSRTHRDELEFMETATVSIRRKRNAITIQKFVGYLRKDGNGWKLAVTASTWFLLDFTFFGLGFNSPQTLSKIWEGSLPLAAQPLPRWDTDYSTNSPNIYSILIQDNVRSLITSSIGAIVGALLLIASIEHWNRKRLLYIGFGVLTALFIIIGASYKSTINDYRGVTITLYAITQLCFYFGPNALTFIIATELFPTKFRCTCHGISAAAGKLGSIIVQIVLAYSNLSSSCKDGTCGIDSPGSTWLGWILLIFAAPMLIGCGITWKWLPELQEKGGPRRYENYSLEVLAEKQREVRKPETAPQTQHEV
jgi:MFS transporter, PHS family, inorganic phosphate transporter